MTKFMSLCAAVVLSLASAVVAQNTQVAKEQFRLQLEISKNGTVVAQPILSLEAGSAGTIALNDGPAFTLTPSRIDADNVRVTCDVQLNNVTPQLRFNLRGQQQSSGSITIGRDFFDIKAAV